MHITPLAPILLMNDTISMRLAESMGARRLVGDAFTAYFSVSPQPLNSRGDSSASIFKQVIARNGGNACIGPELKALLLNTSVMNLKCGTNADHPGTPGELDRLGHTFFAAWRGRLGDQAVEMGLATAQQRINIVEHMESWGSDPNAVVCSHWHYAVGKVSTEKG